MIVDILIAYNYEICFFRLRTVYVPIAHSTGYVLNVFCEYETNAERKADAKKLKQL